MMPIETNDKAGSAGKHRGARGRRGLLAVELILALPLLLIVIGGGVQLVMLLMSGQALSAAAAQGAREASLPGATATSVQSAVEQALTGCRFGAHVDPVIIRVGDNLLDTVSLTEARTGDPVSVTVAVDTSAAAPDLLKFIGVRLSGDKLSATAIMRKE